MDDVIGANEILWLALWLAALCSLWIFRGGSLYYIGARYIAKSKESRYGQSVCCFLVADFCGAWVSAVVACVGLLAARSWPAAVVAVAAGGTCLGLVTSWAIIAFQMRLSFGRAILSWLPCIPLEITTAPMVVTAILLM